jgi:hypothetical protein
MRKRSLLAVLLSVTAAGCSSGIPGIEPTYVCHSWLPISVSRKDVLTDETAKQIAGNNAAAEVWCGERPIRKDPAKVASAQP